MRTSVRIRILFGPSSSSDAASSFGLSPIEGGAAIAEDDSVDSNAPHNSNNDSKRNASIRCPTRNKFTMQIHHALGIQDEWFDVANQHAAPPQSAFAGSW